MSTTLHPHPDPAACSASSARLGEPLAGTGPVATAWLAIEQPGPWGRQALSESHLDPELGRELDRKAEAAGVRIALIRRPGRHALAQVEPVTDPDDGEGNVDADAGTSRRVLLASTIPGRSYLRSMTITDPQQLLDLDFAALAAGDPIGGEPVAKPVLLVCTNGKRDRCCALLGRALTLDLAEAMAALAPADGVEIWESNHLGGHRFAPTAVVLPTGYAYGRLDAESGMAAVEAARAGRMLTRLCRGRSSWSRLGQAAELALRDELQEFAADAVLVTGEQPSSPGQWTVDLTVHGAGYRATVTERAADEPRPESCGKPFGTPMELRVALLEKLG